MGESLLTPAIAQAVLFEQVSDAIVMVDAELRITLWNQGAARLYGWDAAAALGQPLLELLPTKMPEVDSEPARLLMERDSWQGVLIQTCRDGRQCWVEGQLRSLTSLDHSVQGMLLVARDMTAHEHIKTLVEQETARLKLLDAVAESHARLLQAEQQARTSAQQAMERMTRLQTVTVALAETYTLSEVGTVVLSHGLAALDAYAGAILTCTPDDHLELIAATGYAPEVLDQWRRFPLGAAVPLADCVRTSVPLFLASLSERMTRYPELAPAQIKAGQGALVAVPLIVKGRTLGAWGLSFAHDRSFSPTEQNFILTLAHQCAQALERAQLFADEQRSHAAALAAQTRLAFLAQASNMLGQSLDFATTLQQITNLCVPTLADWCHIDWLTDTDTLEQVAITTTNPAKTQQLRQVRQRFKRFASQVLPALKQLRAGQAILINDVPATLWADIATSPEHQQALDGLGVSSLLVVPLQLRGHMLGLLSLVMAESGRRYTSEDQQLVLGLAQRAAQAIDNARLYRDAQQALKLRDEFLLLASHELRTPLTVMLGYAGVLQRRLEISQLSARDQRGLGTLFAQVARLNQVVTWVFDVTRIQIGELQLERQAVDLVSLITAVVGRIQVVSSHTICWEPPATVYVWGDRIRLEQVIHHLVQNAVKYSPDGGDVLVSLELHTDQVIFKVQDHGIGIPAEALSSLFGRFFRASNATIDATPGLGIGLYIVRELVQLHGGEVEVTSVEGVGSTFSVTLPIHIASEIIDLPAVPTIVPISAA